MKEKTTANRMSQHECEHARLKQPQTALIYKGRGGRGNTIPHQPETKHSANLKVKLQPICTHNEQTADCC